MTVHELFLTRTRRSGQGPNRYNFDRISQVPTLGNGVRTERHFTYKLCWSGSHSACEARGLFLKVLSFLFGCIYFTHHIPWLIPGLN
jgi:hypothetical protein